jgi:hypothetical protein
MREVVAAVRGEMNMENVTKQVKSKRTLRAVSYINRMGNEYFIHQGITKSGKPKYFASQKREGAIARLPHGFIFGESINGMVTIQWPKPLLIPEAEINLVKQAVAEFQHLKQYRVEAKDKTILIYEPVGMDSISTLANLGSYSMLVNLKAMLGSRFEESLAKTAKDMGITVSDLKCADALTAEEKRKKSDEHLMRNVQYDAVMRFTLDPIFGPYRVERRCYRGEEHWASLGCGPLGKMLKKYVRHIGKESFFDLI